MNSASIAEKARFNVSFTLKLRRAANNNNNSINDDF